MANSDVTLTNKDELDIYPITRERNVYDENNVDLKTKFKNVVFNDNDVHQFAQELYEESYNILDASKFIGTSGFENAVLEDNGYEITGATGSADAWSYANSNVKLTLDAGTYYFNYETNSSNQDSAANIFTSSNSNIRSGSGAFTLSEKTDIGIMAKIFDGYFKVNLTKTTKRVDFQKFNKNRNITNEQANYLKTKHEHSSNQFDFKSYLASSSNGDYSRTDRGIKVNCKNSADVYVGEVTRYNHGQYYIDAEENTEYTISFKIDSNGASQGNNFVSFAGESNEHIGYKTISWKGVSGVKSNTFTTPVGTKKIFIRFGFQASKIDTSLYVEFYNISLRKGLSKDYFKYNQKFHISNDQARELYRLNNNYKNLFPLVNTNVDKNGLKITFNEDGTFNVIGTPTQNVDVDVWIPIERSGLIDGKRYVLSSNGGADFRAQVVFNKSKTEWLSTPLNAGIDGWVKRKYMEISSSVKCVQYLMQFKAGVEYNLKNRWIQLEEGLEPTNFTPYTTGGIATIKDLNSALDGFLNSRNLLVSSANESGVITLGKSLLGYKFIAFRTKTNAQASFVWQLLPGSLITESMEPYVVDIWTGSEIPTRIQIISPTSINIVSKASDISEYAFVGIN